MITLFGYVVHYSFHQKWTGRYHNSHMVHHQKLYPPSRYLSEAYLEPGKDNTAKFFIIAGLPLILLPILLVAFHIISLPIFITAMISMAIIGIPHDTLHDAFHIKHHWLRRFRWFEHMTDLHYQHHLGNMQTNFGIYWFGWDKLLGTFKKK